MLERATQRRETARSEKSAEAVVARSAAAGMATRLLEAGKGSDERRAKRKGEQTNRESRESQAPEGHASGAPAGRQG